MPRRGVADFSNAQARRIALAAQGFDALAIAAGAMYPVVAPLDTADPSKPQHFGLTVMIVVIVYCVLAILFTLDNISKRSRRR